MPDSSDRSDSSDSSEPARSGDPVHHHRLPVLLVAVALVLVAAAVVTVIVLAGRARTAATAPDTGPIAVPAAPAPGASGRYCSTLMTALPDRLTSHQRRALANPTAGVAAWGDPAIILRCGLPNPEELTCAAALTQFTDAGGGSVAWLRLSDSSAVTYIAVDRPVRVALTLPPGTGLGPVQQLSEVIAQALPSRPVCTDGTINPLDNG